MCNGDLMFYIACVHRGINMSLIKKDSCFKSLSQGWQTCFTFANGMSATSIIILCYVTMQKNATFVVHRPVLG